MSEPKDIKLTGYSRGSGCGCKISPSQLREIISDREEDLPPFPGLLVGNESNDDAAVITLNDDQCLISTTDFFTPVVDNAFEFGKIAAANALSDVYAMGGKPVLAIGILGWPVEKLPTSLAREVLEGARFICRMAGIPLAGGHSIDSLEPFFGLSVNGLVTRSQLKRNNTARPGDLLFITKPIGTGIISAASKRGLAKAGDMEEAIRYMSTPNKVGELFGSLKGVTALTDVTGFGLIGHLIEMCDKGRLGAELEEKNVPWMPRLAPYIEQMIYPDMTMKNFSAYSGYSSTLNGSQLFRFYDPQTSGGLLVAVAPEGEAEYIDLVRSYGLQGIADQRIGKFTPAGEKMIVVK